MRLLVTFMATAPLYAADAETISLQDAENYIFQQTDIKNINFSTMSDETAKLVSFSKSSLVIKFLVVDSLTHRDNSINPIHKEWATLDFYNKMKKMKFEAQKISVKKYTFKIPGVVRQNGWVRTGVVIYSLKSKPIALWEDGFIIN